MAETSRFWNGTATGDATTAPYDADREFADVMNSLAWAITADRGNVFNELNKYAGTGSVSPISIDTGRAMVDGTWHQNDAAFPITIPTPAGATRNDKIVLRKSWAAQTVRITRIAGVEGGGTPALVQVPGVTWDFPLYNVSVTTGGVITFSTDYRAFTYYEEVANLTMTGGTTSPAVSCRFVKTGKLVAVTFPVATVAIGGAPVQLTLASTPAPFRPLNIAAQTFPSVSLGDNAVARVLSNVRVDAAGFVLSRDGLTDAGFTAGAAAAGILEAFTIVYSAA